MLETPNTSYLGIGLYAFADVDRLLGTRSGSVSRWVLGYERSGKVYEPLIQIDHLDLAEHGIVTFREFVELKLIAEFRKHGVGLKAIREAARVFAKELQTPHPFATQRVTTDAKRIFIIIQKEEQRDIIMELPKLQQAMDFVAEYFLPNVDYDADDFARLYWPLGRGKGVVMDPSRQFGQPILNEYRIPTAALYGPFKAGDSIEDIAEWYDVPELAVREAIEFEESFKERTLAA